MKHSSGSRNPCSHVCTGELYITVHDSICVTSGGTPQAFVLEPLDISDESLE